MNTSSYEPSREFRRMIDTDETVSSLLVGLDEFLLPNVTVQMSEAR